MKFATPTSDKWRVASGEGNVRIPRHTPHVTRPASAFTLAEVLAAMLFLAIVIPAAVEAMHVASLAGEVAARKGAAARVADRVLNESLITTNWSAGTQQGNITEGALEYRWTLTRENWAEDAMQLLTAEVKFTAQGRDFSVKLNTLADAQGAISTMDLSE
jgi:hypothetical protein